jgi:ABC-type glycerol-3-phosphate transport system substrate-binding protein
MLRVTRTASATLLAALALAGCGSESDYANDPRPPSPINISAAISPDKVTVSPAKFGAGPVTFLIANLTDDTQEVTVETADLASEAGIKQTTSPINPQGTATLKVDVKEGEYVVRTKSSSIREAHITVGAERPSSQDTLLQP